MRSDKNSSIAYHALRVAWRSGHSGRNLSAAGRLFVRTWLAQAPENQLLHRAAKRGMIRGFALVRGETASGRNYVYQGKSNCAGPLRSAPGDGHFRERQKRKNKGEREGKNRGSAACGRWHDSAAMENSTALEFRELAPAVMAGDRRFRRSRK